MTIQQPDSSEDAAIRQIQELHRLETLRRLHRNQNCWRMHVR